MVNLPLKNGKISYPIKFKNKKIINIGLFGSGKIAYEHAKVVKSYGHNISVLVTKHKSSKTRNFIKKFKVGMHYLSLNKKVDYDSIDAWIVCTPWNVNSKILLKLLPLEKPILIEKPIIINNQELKNLYKKYGHENFRRCHIAYNRNFYEYLPYVINILKKKKDFIIQANLPDQYRSIIKKRGPKLKPFLVEYMTSHWLAFLFVISRNINLKMNIVSKENNGKSFKTLKYSLDKNYRRLIIINHIPNTPKNLNIDIFMEDEYIKISPLEKAQIIKKIRISKKNNQNFYKEIVAKEFRVNQDFKPGFDLQYYEFISTCFDNKKTNKFSITLSDLFKINDLCNDIKK